MAHLARWVLVDLQNLLRYSSTRRSEMEGHFTYDWVAVKSLGFGLRNEAIQPDPFPFEGYRVWGLEFRVRYGLQGLGFRVFERNSGVVVLL